MNMPFFLFCRCLCLALLPALALFLTPFRSVWANSHQSLHDVYLANTEHELHVFRIYGKIPGKTIMLIGGIQGDEPGGYLTADLYADISLQKGNLIVVPRANFYSILLNQRNGLTGDMNRKFGDQEQSQKNMEQEIVTILKKLIDEADCLLNLHEGSGYYHPEWLSEMENPSRFGQSLIYDAARYQVAATGTTIDLATLAERVLDRVNLQIENPRYHFRSNNHDTVSDHSPHLEQRKSATYYALTRANIPAFGVETSKFIPSNNDKVHLQKLVVNAFMAEFDIVPEAPGQHVDLAEIDYVLVQINGRLPYAVTAGATLEIDNGDEVVVTDIIASHGRGLVADFLGVGSYNDTRLPFRITAPTRITIRKDAKSCAHVDIAIRPKDSEKAPSLEESVIEPPLNQLRTEELLINVDGELFTITEGEELAIPRDKVLTIRGVRSNISRLDGEISANLKGYVPPNQKTNDGNDLNYPVFPRQDLWIRYSEKGLGLRYPIHTTYNNNEIGVFWIRLEQLPVH